MYFLILSLIIFIIYLDIHLSNINPDEFKTSCKHIFGMKNTLTNSIVNIKIDQNIKISNFKSTQTIEFKDIQKIQTYRCTIDVVDFISSIVKKDDDILSFIELVYKNDSDTNVLIFENTEENIKTLISQIIQKADKKNIDIIFFDIPYDFSYLYYFITDDDRYIDLPEYIAYKRLDAKTAKNIEKNNKTSIQKIEEKLGSEYVECIEQNIDNEKKIFKKISEYIDDFYSVTDKNEILEKIEILESLKNKSVINKDEFILAKNNLLSRL